VDTLVNAVLSIHISRSHNINGAVTPQLQLEISSKLVLLVGWCAIPKVIIFACCLRDHSAQLSQWKVEDLSLLCVNFFYLNFARREQLADHA